HEPSGIPISTRVELKRECFLKIAAFRFPELHQPRALQRKEEVQTITKIPELHTSGFREGLALAPGWFWNCTPKLGRAVFAGGSHQAVIRREIDREHVMRMAY